MSVARMAARADDRPVGRGQNKTAASGASGESERTAAPIAPKWRPRRPSPVEGRQERRRKASAPKTAVAQKKKGRNVRGSRPPKRRQTAVQASSHSR